MKWVKVEPNPADNNLHPERLPPLDKVVWVVYVDYDTAQVITFGGRVDDGDGWLWAIDDNRGGYKQDCEFNDLTTDDDYHVTRWAEIEWPED